MSMLKSFQGARRVIFTACIAVMFLTGADTADAAQTSKTFHGVKANTGTVTLNTVDGSNTLTLSKDFKVPDAPAPHWQVVDRDNNVYLLQRLVIKGDRLNQTITLPAYVGSVAKVQIWCAWAETLLGETTFNSVVELKTSSASLGAHSSTPFAGVKANTGHAVHEYINGRSTLTLSEDFMVPDSPAPHWQLVDSRGNTYLLQRLDIKGDKFNRSITVPAYVGDIAKVQIWCAWAEVLLGESSFDPPVK